MSNEPDLTQFQKKLAERRAKQHEEELPEFDADLIPEVEERSDESQAIDQILNNLDIEDAYIRWCGKMHPNSRKKQAEGIMISCPIPGHVDKNPSAWMNSEKKTWFCGGCQVGGDIYDLAAIYFHYATPGYKTDGSFPALRKEMIESLGYRVDTLPGDVLVVTSTEPQDEESEPESEPESTEVAEVIELYDTSDIDVLLPGLNWRTVVDTGTFLDTYMTETSIDDVPEEFHFWNGLIAIGLALGRQVKLFDYFPVYGNLFVCTLGRSGTGKTKSNIYLNTLLKSALPHDWTNPTSTGARRIATPGSAEALINSFSKPIYDIVNPKLISYFAPVRGVVQFNELSDLMGRAHRKGSVLQPTLMRFYDMEEVISTSSTTHGEKFAHEPFASCTTTVQPRVLRTLMTETDDSAGFVNRWVFAPGTEKPKVAVGGVKVDIEPAVFPLKEIQGWAASFKPDEQMQWSEEALKLFTDFFHTQVEPDKKESATDVLVRIDLLMKKLILLFTANLREKTVPTESVEHAISCYPYLVESYGVPANQLGNNIASEVSDAVLYFAKKELERNNRGVTLNQLGKSLRRRKYPHDLIIKTVDSLTKLGFLEPTAPNAGRVGRPTTRYKYVQS